MLKPFTDLQQFSIVLTLVAILLQGCATDPASARKPAGAAQQTAAVDYVLEPLAADLPPLPTPRVHGTFDQPELAGPWINLGQVYVALNQPEDARLAFQQAIRANPRNCTAYNELGVLSRQSGDFTGAEVQYLTCLEMIPSFKDAYLNLGILYELYLGKLPEALEAYRRYQSLLLEPDHRVRGWVMDLQRRLGV
jgi:tetratricopeptide (TPR) repeat protein